LMRRLKYINERDTIKKKVVFIFFFVLL